MDQGINIVLLTSGGVWGRNVVAYFAQRDVPITQVICEQRVSRTKTLQRRIKKLGFWIALGQVLFQTMIVPVLNIIYRARVNQIKADCAITDTPIPDHLVHKVASVNDTAVITLLQQLQPDVVLVTGTRIIKASVLNSIAAPFINIHAGITPLYRGVHGAYWASVERNSAACGVTIHLVDQGIDTGEVLEQALITPTQQDSFITYPLLQLATGLPLLYNAVQTVREHCLMPQAPLVRESRLRSHPTIWFYLWQWLRHGIK